jgi:tRNA A-37 threonylcarbamoyl transferase component Bud32
MNGWVGRTLSKVRIDRLLGRGGMAEIYLGTHATLDRQVAVKILHAHLLDDIDLQRRFLDEAQAVAQLRHPNIVQVYDFDIADGRPYIVMELLQGISLARYMRGLHASGLTLPMGTVCRLTDGIAGALDYAHGRGIVHRDVKPANIMLRQGSRPIDSQVPLLPDVEPVLTDFGVARLTNTTHQTATGTVLGTPAYMSPEQVQGDEIDGRSDIYSLGIVVYEMLAGEPPFNHDTTPAAVLMKQLQAPPPPVPQASPAIQAVIDRALAKLPADRFAHAGDMASRLRAAGRAPTGRSIPTQAPPSRRQPARRKGRVPWLAIGVVGVMLCMLTTGVAALGVRAWLNRNRPTEQAVAAAPSAGTAQGPAPTTAGPTAMPTAIVQGEVQLRGNGLDGHLDGSPAPGEGQWYFAWLEDADGATTPLGPATFQDGRVDFTFAGPGWYESGSAGLLLSVEPAGPAPAAPGDVRYRGSLPDETRAELAVLLDVVGAGELPNLVEEGLSRQVVHFTSHQGYVLDSINQSNLPAAKQHAEHVINISEGRSGPDYGDWNGDGRVENPGDDVGLIPYLALLRSLVAGSPDPPPDLLASVDSLIEDAGRARDLATRIAASDAIEEVQPLSSELASYQLSERVDQLLAHAADLDLAITVPFEPAAN